MLGRCRPYAVHLAIGLAVCFAVCLAAEAQRERPEAIEREYGSRERRDPREKWKDFFEFARRHGGKDVSELEIPQIIALVRAWLRIGDVGLTEEQSVRLLHLGREMRKKRAELAEQRGEAREQLKELVDDPESSDDAIVAQLKTLEKLQESHVAFRRWREEATMEGLSVRQRARLELFRYYFNRHVRERLIRYIEAKRRGDRPREPRGGRRPRGRRRRGDVPEARPPRW